LVEVRPNAVRLGIVVVLGVVFTLTLWLVAPGLFGLSDATLVTTQVNATVTRGTGCGQAADGEIVTFVQDGKEHQAKLDGCGHREGEPVDVSVPAGASGPDIVVHAAQAATGDSDWRRPVAFLLFLASSLAGGAFIHLWFNVLPPMAPVTRKKKPVEPVPEPSMIDIPPVSEASSTVIHPVTADASLTEIRPVREDHGPV
jgi:hypothetical protein